MTCGGTGEFPHLSREEKKAVTENVAKVAKPAAPWKRFSSAKMQRRGAHAGIDSQFYPALCVGAAGIFCTACVAPRMMVEIDDAFAQGHHKKALAAHARIMILATLLSPETKDRELRAYE
jgi:dihydrodipicolinate synthase/N-acetylneuraminate lyase